MRVSGHRGCVDDSAMAGTGSAVVPTNRYAILLAVFIAFGALFLL